MERAQKDGIPSFGVQHHHAHIAACLAENKLPPLETVIGISFDGTGFGEDGTIWGGEFFLGGLRGLERAGHLLPIFLPGGDAAAREPWRTALSLLSAIPAGEKTARRFTNKFGRQGELVLASIVQRRGGVMTTSCGRLFDGVAALLGLGNNNSYEGELPSLLQAEAEGARPQKQLYPYAIEIKGNMPVLNMLLAIEAMLADKRSRSEKAFCFHLTLANGLLDMAIHCTRASGIRTAALSGGVFQNTLLLGMSRDLLLKNGFQVLLHRQVPPNDGGIALGQAALAAMKYQKES